MALVKIRKVAAGLDSRSLEGGNTIKFKFNKAGIAPAFFFVLLSPPLSKNVQKRAKGALFGAVEIR